MSRKNFTKTGARRAPQVTSPESMAMEWWRSDGIYIDPDSDEDDWFNKRKELAQMAFVAGYQAAQGKMQ